MVFAAARKGVQLAVWRGRESETNLFVERACVLVEK